MASRTVKVLGLPPTIRPERTATSTTAATPAFRSASPPAPAMPASSIGGPDAEMHLRGRRPAPALHLRARAPASPAALVAPPPAAPSPRNAHHHAVSPACPAAPHTTAHNPPTRRTHWQAVRMPAAGSPAYPPTGRRPPPVR